MKIIGLTGYAQSGKDTFASFLIEHGFVRVSFAEPLYAAVYQLDALLPVQEHSRWRRWWSPRRVGYVRLQEVVDDKGWDWAKVNFPEVRRLLQAMGTEVGRNLFGQNFWVDQAMEAIKSIEASEDFRYGDITGVVLTDVRFQNEYDAIKSMGGELVRVIRPGNQPVNAHISDNYFTDENWTDSVVLNDGTLAQLDAQSLDFCDECLSYGENP